MTVRRRLATAGEPRRPLVCYFGGKWRLAPWIISHFPEHQIYVEPFGGGGSVLLRKPRSYAEVYNDMDGGIVNLFRMTRDRGADLVRAIEMTPFARAELVVAHEDGGSDIENARRMVVRSFQGFGADSVLNTDAASGFRADSKRPGSTPAHDWATLPDSLRMVVERMRGVVIENQDAMRVMLAHDSPRTLHYADPPYVHDTRRRPGSHRYRHEMSVDGHAALLVGLMALDGMVAVSGYEHEVYMDMLSGWRCARIDSRADGGAPRVECLWLSPALDDATRSARDPFGLAP